MGKFKEGTKLFIDLVGKHERTPKMITMMEGLVKEHDKFKIGQVIDFWGGANGDIRYRAEIIGFDTDGLIYVDWDCYWFPIADSEEREIDVN